jgi:hypothetical protein
MLFVILMLRIGWRVQAKRDWASFPNEWAILRPSANGITWKHLLEKKVRVGLRFGTRLALPSPADISLGACCQSCLVSFSEYCLPASLNPTHASSIFCAPDHAGLHRASLACAKAPVRLDVFAIAERRKLLANLLKKAPENIRFSEELLGAANEVLRVARQFGLEGLIAKRPDSR